MFAALALLIGLAGEQMVEDVQRQRMTEHERRHVLSVVSQLRARLEALISGNLLMVRGLSAVIAAQPNIDQAAFERIAAGMVGDEHALRNIAAAPDLVIRLVHPLAGNEAAIGLDFRTHPTQREAAMRAVETGHTVIAGPLPLVQGGTGLIAREPVYRITTGGGRGEFWGLVSTVVDVEQLYRLAGLSKLSGEHDLDLAIRGRDGRGGSGDVFFGEAALFTESAVLADVSLPGGSWQIAAAPSAGWGSHIHGHVITNTRLLGLLLSVLFAGLVFAVLRNAQQVRSTAQQLRESQALFQGFMDNMPAGAFVQDPSRRHALFENRWLRHNLPHGPHGCGMDGDADLALLRREPQLLRHDHVTGDGQAMTCETLRFLLDDGRGRELVGSVVMDVSARVHAEQALDASRARLRALLDTIPDLVWMKDLDGVYLACNQRFETLFGAREDEIVGRRDRDFVPDELADTFRAHDKAAIETGRPTTNEQTVTFASDGHEELLETIKTPVHDAAGKVIGVLGIARDITARRAAERALRANAERLETAGQIARIGNWEYRVADGGLAWSDQTYRLFGLQPGEREPDYPWLLSQIHPEDRDAHDAFLADMLASTPGDTFAGRRFRLRLDDGTERVVSVHVQIEYGPQDKPERLFGTVQDVTEREALTRYLSDQLDELTRWQGVMLGREERIQQLKREVNALLREQGRAPRYRQGEDE